MSPAPALSGEGPARRGEGAPTLMGMHYSTNSRATTASCTATHTSLQHTHRHPGVWRLPTAWKAQTRTKRPTGDSHTSQAPFPLVTPSLGSTHDCVPTVRVHSLSPGCTLPQPHRLAAKVSPGARGHGLRRVNNALAQPSALRTRVSTLVPTCPLHMCTCAAFHMRPAHT